MASPSVATLWEAHEKAIHVSFMNRVTEVTNASHSEYASLASIGAHDYLLLSRVSRFPPAVSGSARALR